MRDFHKSWFSTWISETISSICKLLWKDSRFYPHRGDLTLRCVSCWLHPCSHFLRFDDSNFYPCWTVTMDEPMSALDLGNQADILQLLMSIKSEGKTLLMVSHNPLHALSSNGTVCLLDDRHIFAYGPSNEILSDRNIKQIYGNKIKLHQDSKTFSFEL